MEITNIDQLKKSTIKLYNKIEKKLDNTTGETTSIVSSFLKICEFF